MSKSTFREAIEKQHYRVNECWINCLYDHYRDTLLSTDKTKNVVSRAMILEIVGRTEENIPEGIGILSMEPFFVRFRLQVRVYVIYYKKSMNTNRPVRSPHNKALYCLQKGNHIYTLNHGIKALQQFSQPTERETVSHELLIFPLRAASSSADIRIAQDTQDILNIIQDTKAYICASELSLEQPLQITEVFVLQNNFEKLFLDLQSCGLCSDTTFHEVLANKRIRVRFNSLSKSTSYMVEDDRDPRRYRMIETIDDILAVVVEMDAELLEKKKTNRRRRA